MKLKVKIEVCHKKMGNSSGGYKGEKECYKVSRKKSFAQSLSIK